MNVHIQIQRKGINCLKNDNKIYIFNSFVRKKSFYVDKLVILNDY